jgi:hypothetical protein
LEMTIFLTLDSTNPNVGTESIALVCVNKSIILIIVSTPRRADIQNRISWISQ